LAFFTQNAAIHALKLIAFPENRYFCRKLIKNCDSDRNIDLITKVTRLGDFLLWTGILKITEVAHNFWLLFPRFRLCNNFEQKCIGQYFCHFFTNSSGHPADHPGFGTEGLLSVFFFEVVVKRMILTPSYS
jgi:hypothetical protein